MFSTFFFFHICHAESTIEANRLSLFALLGISRIEAILYRTIVLDYPPMTTDLFIRTIESRPASFFATHVKNLYITNFVPYEQAQRLLAVCTDLTSLACWTSAGGPHTNLPLIVKSDSASFHKLRRLSISLNALAFPCLSSQESFLRQLTHLEVVNPPMASAEEWKTFLTLPSLTHLALGNLYAPAHGDILPALDFLLEESTALRVLVLLSTNQPFLRLLQEDCLLQDPRVITLESFHRGMDVFEFWNSVRRHERDPWTLPEEMIMTRKANKRLL